MELWIRSGGQMFSSSKVLITFYEKRTSSCKCYNKNFPTHWCQSNYPNCKNFNLCLQLHVCFACLCDIIIIVSLSDAFSWSASTKTRSDSAYWCPHFHGTPYFKISTVSFVYPVTWGGVVRPATTGHVVNAANSTFAWNCSYSCVHQHVPSCLQSWTGEGMVCACNSNFGNVRLSLRWVKWPINLKLVLVSVAPEVTRSTQLW